MKTMRWLWPLALLCCGGLISSVSSCRTAEPVFEAVRAPHQVTQYIALGDSISTDDYPGRDRGAVSLFYLNRDEDFPEFEERDLLSLNAEMQLIFAASNGATTETVLHAQLSQLPPNPPGVTLVTLTIGGNDLLRAIHGDPRRIAEHTTKIVNNIQRILTIVQTTFPSSLILLGTIYDPTDGVGDLFSPDQPLTDALEMIDQINARIRSFARPPRIQLVDIHQHFIGHGSHHADPANPYHDQDDPTYWFTSKIEPNERGASEVRRLFWNALEAGLQDLKGGRDES
ncbi:MAG TPA: SGNH/GDSL hydrolase family protein [Nitrospirales bacterium]|nr:SGNH/GDSL hydrolase family protein [Nitrospirales bacterium]HIA13535.1 SGNH/GDSL hydrolase family protein [Nitrospirales bacterium]HIN32696.1 SGNH/GDSL hydrolase family protein [Nitrospirales bacterium]